MCGCQRLVECVVLKACRACAYLRLVDVCVSKACRVFVKSL